MCRAVASRVERWLYREVEPRVKTTIAIITILAVVGLTGIACGEQSQPDPGPQGTPVQTYTPDPSTTMTPSESVGGGTGGTTPPAFPVHVKNARIMLGGGTAPTAHLLVTTPCNSPAGPPTVSGYYPWIDVFMVDQNRDCGADGGNGLVEVSIPLPDRAHLFEACKIYTVVINKKRVHALAVDGAALCPPETSDPSPEEALTLMNVEDFRLSGPPGSVMRLVADYRLTASCVRPEGHRLERVGDRLKVYITVTAVTSGIPIRLECQGLLEKYSVPLRAPDKVFKAGDMVTVWVNGVERTLIVPELGQVAEPATRVPEPAGRGQQPQVAENRPPRPTQIPVDPSTVLPTQERYGVTPGGFALLTAPVEEVSMALSGGTDTAPTLTLVTVLPNSCQEFSKYEVIGFNPGLSVNVTNEYRPPPKNGGCDGPYGTVETHIALEGLDLGRTYETCVTYNVYVNGVAHWIQVQPASPGERCPSAPLGPDKLQAIAPIGPIELHYDGMPPHHFLEVTYILPTTCTLPGGYEVEQDGDHFDVRVFNTEPAGSQELCGRSATVGDHKIPLEGLEAGRQITVSINGGPSVTLTVPSNKEPSSIALPVPGKSVLVQPTSTGHRVEIGLGYSVKLPDQDVRISFDRVVEDSLCPANVRCIWAGKAVIRLTVTEADTSTEVLLSLEPDSPVSSPWIRVASHQTESKDLEIRLISLEQYPGADDDKEGVTPTAVLEIMVDEG